MSADQFYYELEGSNCVLYMFMNE